MTPWEISEQLTALFKIHIFTFPNCRFWWRWRFLRWLRRTTPIWIWSKHLSWGRSHLSLDSSGIKSFFESTTCYCCHFMYLCVSFCVAEPPGLLLLSCTMGLVSRSQVLESISTSLISSMVPLKFLPKSSPSSSWTGLVDEMARRGF